MAEVNEKRCPSGIPGFDELCQGGFFRNSINSIFGGPGSGKTTFLLQFLWNGVTMFNEKGLYVSFESHDEDVYEDALTYGWDFRSLEKEGKIKFLRLSPKENIQDIDKKIIDSVLNTDIKRVCIDPISILSFSLKNESVIREIIYDLTCSLKRLGVTTVLSDETMVGTSDILSNFDETRTLPIKFLSDGLINLYSSGFGGESDRALGIMKMRRTNHVRGPIPYKITDKGIIVFPKSD